MALLKVFKDGQLAKQRNNAAVDGQKADNVRTLRPRYRIEEVDTAYVARLDMPGVSRKDLEIQLARGVLEVSGKRDGSALADWKSLSGGGDEAAVEYTLRLAVGDEVDGEAIGAKLEDGVLRLTLPKAEEKRPRKIAVN